MMGRLIARVLRIPTYTDANHLQTLEHARAMFERMVGTCSACGTDLRLIVDDEPKRVVCDCGVAIPPAFFANNERPRHA